MNNAKETIGKLEKSLENIYSNENVIYFLVYDTRDKARASVKYIYDMALALKNSGYNAKMLVEDKTYSGVLNWLGERYNSLETLIIKENKVEIRIEDILVVPEYYSNILESLSNVRCVKIMLVQQKEYIFETLPIGSRWSDFGFDRAIVTTEFTKKYINEYFKEVLVHIIPPIIEDNFSPSKKTSKPLIAISCKDRSDNKRIISEFYLKFPHLRWITFRDMIQLTYDEFAEALKECLVSVWVDDDSTFGTFPLESMKCGVPVIGKIPKNEPDWLGENGMWTYENSKISEILGTYVLAWLDDAGISDNVKQKMKETLLPYDSEITKTNIINIFESFKNKRIEAIKKAIEKVKEENIEKENIK